MHDEREMDGLSEDGGYGTYSTGGPPIQLFGRREFIRNPEERAALLDRG